MPPPLVCTCKALLLFTYSSTLVVANESFIETRRCFEAVASKAEVWVWQEEGLQSAELEQAVEAHRGVKYLSSMGMGELVGMKDRIKAFRWRLGKVKGIKHATRLL